MSVDDKVLHFNDPPRVLNTTEPPFPPTLALPQQKELKSPTLSPQIKPRPSHQKSNNEDLPSQQAGAPAELTRNWTLQQQNQLISLHNEKGNRWVQIAQILKKSDNEVKNRYHSRMRKGVRKINKLMADTLPPHHRPLNANIISKIIQTAEDVYVPTQGPSSKQAKEAYQLKNAILHISTLPEEGLPQEERAMVERTVERIGEFNRNFKKKCKVTPVHPPICSKYKGKEIKTLLRENQLNNLQKQRKTLSCSQETPNISTPHHEQTPLSAPQPLNQLQTYLLFNQPCYGYPSFYMTSLPTSYLLPYDRFSAMQASEYAPEGQICRPSMAQKSNQEKAQGEDSVSF